MRKKIVSLVAKILGVTIYIDEVRHGSKPEFEQGEGSQG